MSRLFYHVMQDNAGNLLFDVSGTMRVAGSGTLATIYGDEELTVVLPNPMTNHPSFGSFKCFLGAGAYDFYMAKSGYTFETLTGVQGHGTMALQNANAVTIGGHANTGVLDVQGSVVASDVANQYFGVRVWPTAPSGATQTQGIRIEPATGAASATAGIRGVVVNNQPVTSAGVCAACDLQMNAGTGRYNINAGGTAQNYFAGNVGCGNSTPTYPLDVTGNVRVTGEIGLGRTPFVAKLEIVYPRATRNGITLTPDADSGTFAMAFQNAASTMVGSIHTTATVTTYATSSDVRLKTAVQALGNALSTIQALRPVSFKWKADNSDGHGFLANEVQAVVPEAVTGQPGAVDAAGQIVPQQIDHSKLVPWLVAALQESVAQVQALTARVTSLEQQLVVS